MADAIPKKVVDFLPRLSATGDMVKMADDAFPQVNSTIVNLMTLLNMPTGCIPDMPDVGCLEILMELFYSTPDMHSDILLRLQNKVAQFLLYSINFDLQETSTSDEYMLIITISGLPKVSLQLKRVSDKFARVVNPQILNSST